MSERILVIEDDTSIRDSIEDFLLIQGFQVSLAPDGLTGLQMAIDAPPDLLLLDLMLPHINGLDLCKKLRERNFHAPIIMLTALGDELDRVLGLEMGADDYVIKPFGMRELHARIRAHLRRAQRTHETPKINNIGELSIDRHAMRVLHGSTPLKLSSKEFLLLCYFLDHPDRAISRNELLDRVWGFEQMPTTRTIDTHVLNLRKKIGPYFTTIHGVGYRFEPDLLPPNP